MISPLLLNETSPVKSEGALMSLVDTSTSDTVNRRSDIGKSSVSLDPLIDTSLFPSEEANFSRLVHARVCQKLKNALNINQNSQL